MGGLSCPSVCIGRSLKTKLPWAVKEVGGGVRLSPPDRLFQEEGGAVGERVGLFPRPGL